MADLYDVLLPEQYSYGATFSPRFKTNVVMVNSGKEQRTSDWQYALWEVSVNFTTQRKEQVDDIRNLFLQTRGASIGFLFNSKEDNTVLTTDGIANSDGVLKGHPKFRLFKTYQNSLGGAYDKYYKRIFKPAPGTVKVYNNGVLTGWTVDYANGTVSLPVLANKEITAITKATNAKITSIGHGFTNGNKIYLKDITGMTELNHMVVTVVTVIDADNFTINVNTLSYSTFTYNALTSYAQKFIDGTENITWDGKFYLPVRFKEDVNPVTCDNFNSWSCATTLTELRLDEVNEYELDD